MAFSMRVRAVGATFGIEGRLDLADRATEAEQHFGQHMIRLEAQEVLAKLHRHMPIAEMVGGTAELQTIAGVDFEQRFRGGLDFDHPPVAGKQTVAMPQHGTGRQDVTQLLATDQGHSLATFPPGIVRQHQTITGGGVIVGEGFGK